MHIGQLIKQQMDEQGKTVSWLARELAYCRTNIYKIYDKKSIDTDLLLRICALLNYDFFSIYSQELRKVVPNEFIYSLIGDNLYSICHGLCFPLHIKIN